MILAAGRGERMRPLTDHVPKPLLEAGGQTLIGRTLSGLAAAGVSQVVVNLAYRGQQIRDYLGDGSRFGMSIQYSDEGNQALETAGGILKALPELGNEPFLVVNGDVATDFPWRTLLERDYSALAHLILVANPDFKQQGDFSLADGMVKPVSGEAGAALTFSGISVYHPEFFAHCEPGVAALGPLLRKQAALGKVSADLYSGFWMDIGTPARLQAYCQYLASAR